MSYAHRTLRSLPHWAQPTVPKTHISPSILTLLLSQKRLPPEIILQIISHLGEPLIAWHSDLYLPSNPRIIRDYGAPHHREFILRSYQYHDAHPQMRKVTALAIVLDLETQDLVRKRRAKGLSTTRQVAGDLEIGLELWIWDHGSPACWNPPEVLVTRRDGERWTERRRVVWWVEEEEMLEEVWCPRENRSWTVRFVGVRGRGEIKLHGFEVGTYGVVDGERCKEETKWAINEKEKNGMYKSSLCFYSEP